MSLNSKKHMIGGKCIVFGLAVLFGLQSAGFGQDFERYRPRNFNTPSGGQRGVRTQDNEATGSEKVLVDALDALVILDSKDKVKATDANADATGIQYDFADTNSLVYSQGFQQIANKYIGGPISLRRLNQFAREIIQFYKNSDQPVVDVQIPEQKITGGTVQIVIIETRVGNVTVQSGPYFDPNQLTKWVSSTYSGSRLYESSIMDDLFWLNQSSFRKVEVDLKPGEVEGTTDVIFKSNEVRPWRTYVGYEDSGVRSLGLERLYGGIIWGNAFGRDGTLSYQYTADAKFNKLHAHSASWSRAFSRAYSASMSGSWAEFNPSFPGVITQSGESWQMSSGMTRHLVKNRNIDSSMTLGTDFKSTNNNLEFGGTNILTSGAELFNIRFGMRNLSRTDEGDYFFWSNDLFFGPGGGLTNKNNATAFSSIRQATTPDYVYNRFRTESKFNMGDLELRTRSVAQYAFDRLLFSETLGLGGYDSVRGYDQRVFSGDSGWVSNVEIGLRPINLGTDEDPNTLSIYSFIDAGKAYTRSARPGEITDLFLLSSGVGLRWNCSANSSLRVDYGHGFEKAPGIVSRNRIHVGYVNQFGARPRSSQN